MSKIIVLVFSLLMVSAAQANYVKGAAGLTIGGEAEVDTAAGTFDEDLEMGFLFPLIAAYGFDLTDTLYGEAELSIRQNDYDDGPGDAEVIAAAFNVVGSIAVQKAELTGGAGATLGQYDLSSSVDGAAFGLQFFGGADFKIQEGIRIGGELRHFMTVTDVDSDGEYSNTAILFTAKFDM